MLRDTAATAPSDSTVNISACFLIDSVDEVSYFAIAFQT